MFSFSLDGHRILRSSAVPLTVSLLNRNMASISMISGYTFSRYMPILSYTRLCLSMTRLLNVYLWEKWYLLLPVTFLNPWCPLSTTGLRYSLLAASFMPATSGLAASATYGVMSNLLLSRKSSSVVSTKSVNLKDQDSPLFIEAPRPHLRSSVKCRLKLDTPFFLRTSTRLSTCPGIDRSSQMQKCIFPSYLRFLQSDSRQ